MLKVSPITTHRIAMNGANMVVSSHHRAGETFQDDTESSRCDVKGAGLEPDTIRIRNPETVIFQVDVGNEVFAAPSIRLEAVGEIAEGSDWHKAMIGGQTSDVRKVNVNHATFSRPLTQEGRNSKYRLRPSMSRQ